MLPDKMTDDFSLQLVDDTPASDAQEKEKQSVEKKRAAYRVDSRGYVDRRQSTDRRDNIRFEDDRRQFIRREEDRAWRLS